jgi:hypothetical protein
MRQIIMQIQQRKIGKISRREKEKSADGNDAKQIFFVESKTQFWH